VLRGRLGETFGSFGGVLGDFWELLEPLEKDLNGSSATGHREATEGNGAPGGNGRISMRAQLG